MPKHPKSIKYKAFKGISNISDPQSIDPSFLIKALNVNIDKTGSVSKRKGYTKKDTANYSSIWASDNGLGCYAVRNGDLVRLHEDYSFDVLKASVGNIRLSFEEIDGIIYYNSEESNGLIFNGTHREWGIEKNHLSPTLTSTTGLLVTGTYQVAFTYVYSDGRESGTSRASIIEVNNNSGISLSIPTNTDPNIISARIYCSTLNGNTLYYSGTTTLNSTFVISDVSNLINPLRTFNLDKPPTGQRISYYKGRMYVAQDNVLWYSEPFQYEYFKLDSNYFEFPERIKEIMPVDDGLWVCADRIYFLFGSSPEQLQRNIKEYAKVIEGTATRVSGSYIHSDTLGYKWLISSDLGIFLLANQGSLINLTATNVELDSADSGTSLFLQDGGMNQYLSILKTNQNPNNSVMGDLIETTIVRNGVIIP